MWPAYHSTSPIGDIEDHPGGIELSDADGDDDDLHAAAGSSIMCAIPQPVGGTERHFCARSENRKSPPFGSVSWMQGVVMPQQGVPWVFEAPPLGTKLRQAYAPCLFVANHE